jgi:hypothetical protein
MSVLKNVSVLYPSGPDDDMGRGKVRFEFAGIPMIARMEFRSSHRYHRKTGFWWAIQRFSPEDRAKYKSWKTLQTLGNLDLTQANSELNTAVASWIYDNGPWAGIMAALPGIKWKLSDPREKFLKDPRLSFLQLFGKDTGSLVPIKITCSASNRSGQVFPASIRVESADAICQLTAGSVAEAITTVEKAVLSARQDLKKNSTSLVRQKKCLQRLRKTVSPALQVDRFRIAPTDADVLEEIVFEMCNRKDAPHKRLEFTLKDKGRIADVRFYASAIPTPLCYRLMAEWKPIAASCLPAEAKLDIKSVAFQTAKTAEVKGITGGGLSVAAVMDCSKMEILCWKAESHEQLLAWESMLSGSFLISQALKKQVEEAVLDHYKKSSILLPRLRKEFPKIEWTVEARSRSRSGDEMQKKLLINGKRSEDSYVSIVPNIFKDEMKGGICWKKYGYFSPSARRYDGWDGVILDINSPPPYGYRPMTGQPNTITVGEAALEHLKELQQISPDITLKENQSFFSYSHSDPLSIVIYDWHPAEHVSEGLRFNLQMSSNGTATFSGEGLAEVSRLKTMVDILYPELQQEKETQQEI